MRIKASTRSRKARRSPRSSIASLPRRLKRLDTTGAGTSHQGDLGLRRHRPQSQRHQKGRRPAALTLLRRLRRGRRALGRSRPRRLPAPQPGLRSNSISRRQRLRPRRTRRMRGAPARRAIPPTTRFNVRSTRRMRQSPPWALRCTRTARASAVASSRRGVATTAPTASFAISPTTSGSRRKRRRKRRKGGVESSRSRIPLRVRQRPHRIWHRPQLASTISSSSSWCRQSCRRHSSPCPMLMAACFCRCPTAMSSGHQEAAP
mmetsp:Transcript_130402/g.291749  ORF Transcript_130402/g.291749 Transcript_130402/m.291749 type:complete len:262 (+) Transcript_130402:550-1335(+)